MRKEKPKVTEPQPRHVCSAEDYAARRPAFNRIARNPGTGVLFEQP